MTYNGWANWETWAINLWFSTDEWQGASAEEMAEEVGTYVEEIMEDPYSGFLGDVISGFFSSVQWWELEENHEVNLEGELSEWYKSEVKDDLEEQMRRPVQYVEWIDIHGSADEVCTWNRYEQEIEVDESMAEEATDYILEECRSPLLYNVSIWTGPAYRMSAYCPEEIMEIMINAGADPERVFIRPTSREGAKDA